MQIPSPGPEDPKTRGPFYLNRVWLEHREDRWWLWVEGSLPTPCHQARVQVQPDPEKLQVEVFTVRDPNAICIQVLKPFTGYVDLTPWATKHPGRPVVVNGQEVGRLGD